jgi:hypothetical protein
MKIWLYLWDFLKKDGTIRMPKQKDIAEALGSKKESISRAFKILKEHELIAKINNEWRYNPFLFGVSGQSDLELNEAQKIWNEYVGYYAYDKSDKKYKNKHFIKEE